MKQGLLVCRSPAAIRSAHPDASSARGPAHECFVLPWEIWDQTAGRVNAFVSSIGTGGTLAGTALYLKERSKEVAVVCADPYGAAMWSWFRHGHTEVKDGESYAEGIGQTRVTKNLEGIAVDRSYRIPDQTGMTLFINFYARKGCFSAFLPASISLERCVMPESAAPGRRSSPSSATQD
jgi:cysteine synthase